MLCCLLHQSTDFFLFWNFSGILFWGYFLVFWSAQDCCYQDVSSVNLATIWFPRVFDDFLVFKIYWHHSSLFWIILLLWDLELVLILSRLSDCMKVVTRSFRDLCIVPFDLWRNLSKQFLLFQFWFYFWQFGFVFASCLIIMRVCFLFIWCLLPNCLQLAKNEIWLA